jgi:hypothetical protein
MGGLAAVATGLFVADRVVDALVPKPPELPPIPTAPELDTGARDARDEAARLERERRLASGRASTILTGGLGDTSQPQLASAVLLGQ